MSPSDLGPDDTQLLADLLQHRGEFRSARALGTTTMMLRRLTELGAVEMSLSKSGTPHYRVTEAGELAAIGVWE